MEKIIIHIDGDAFFASCEIALNHKLKGKPVVTGFERGIASAMSYEAKALGIYRGMPIYQIRELFPEVVVVSSNFFNYSIFAERMYSIVGRYTDLVHEYSIDECFADITGLDRLYGISYEEIAKKIKADLQRELGVTFSLGLAPTKVLAKVASKYKKPDGFTVIQKKEIHEFLKNISIGKVWGIGPETATKIRKHGIETAGDFINMPLNWVEMHLARPFVDIWYELNGVPIYGIDLSVKDEQKSVQSTRTFKPSTNDAEFLLSQLSKNVEEACFRVRSMKLISRKINYFLKTENFTYKRGEIFLINGESTPAVIMSEIKSDFYKLFNNGVKYRATGVTLASLIPISMAQPGLFEAYKASEKWRSIFESIDTIDKRFGSNSVILGSSLRALAQKNKKLIISKKLRIPYMGEVN